MDRFIIRTPRNNTFRRSSPAAKSDSRLESKEGDGNPERPAKRPRLQAADAQDTAPDADAETASVISDDVASDTVNESSGRDASPLGEKEQSAETWGPGKGSIYVEAFNLALDTVLEEEAHLFSSRELAIFEQWRQLDYQARYLYVRLFLRKTASWHRIARLGYQKDVADMDAAVECLQRDRPLPGSSLDFEAADKPPDSFTFADASQSMLTDLGEAASLLGLEELKSFAKDVKVQGRNKADMIGAICRMGQQQSSLMGVGVTRGARRHSPDTRPLAPARHGSNRTQHFLDRVLALTGPCIRLTPSAFALFERAHLVFYRSTEWTEKSLTTIILARTSRRNFPSYLVCRTSNVFPSRAHLLEYEAALKVETEVDRILESGSPPGEAGLKKVVELFEGIYTRWRALLREEHAKGRTVYADGEGPYLRRFTAGHSYTRVAHKAAHALGRLKDHGREHGLLCELLGQRLFHTARRGSWYQRKALLEENYMHELEPEPVATTKRERERRKKHGMTVAAATCEAGLQDNECHVIYHHDLQKRLVKLEKRLGVPLRLRHDFGHVELRRPVEHTVEGIQVRRQKGVTASTRTVWIDELNGGGECTVEDMCLGWYRSQGWHGHHSEGGIIRTIFALLFFDILFLPVPNVFQTAFQTCPLDLHTDAFYAARMPEINRRLAATSNGDAERLIREVYERERARRTAAVGLDWDYDVEDLVGLARGLGGPALAAVCRVLAQEYRYRGGGGMPDLVLWRGGEGKSEEKPEAMFAEVKSRGDRLSDTQRLWMHVLAGAGVTVALCHAVAREVRESEAVGVKGHAARLAGGA